MAKNKQMSEVSYNLAGQDHSLVRQLTLATYTENALRTYGSYVVEDRAVADYRDGLKPVHRALLWSLVGLGLRPSSGYKKSARVVGEALGKYHPHGDGSAYGAMVTIANTMPPAVDGQGNWGTPVNNAAAYRYTEAKMSKFSHMFMVDSQYLDVVPKVPNFSGDDTIPLYLPALLPYMLFNGSVPVPAYGVRAGNPSFSFSSVAKVVIAGLKGRKLTATYLAKHLKIQHAFGCEDTTEEEDYIEFLKEGRGNIVYAPLIEADVKAKTINVRSFVPAGLSSKAAIDKTLAKIASWQGVKRCFSKQGKKSKGSGPYGALFVVEIGRNVSEDDFHNIVDKVDKEITSSVNYRLGITVRKHEDTNAFHYLSYVKFFEVWLKYRVRLELDLIRNRIQKTEREIHINEVYLFAVENMKKLLAALPKVLTSKDPDVALSKALKIPVEDATIILDRKVRQLAKMEAAQLKDKLAELYAELKTLKADEKNPSARAARDTMRRVTQYLKKPDLNKSRLTFD
jgi:topoisomerase-4 subunit A